MTRGRVLGLVPFAALAVLVLVVPLPVVPEPGTREATVVARQFAFEPAVLHVQRGDRVRLTVAATDVVHGFHLDGYPVEARVEPGSPRQVEFVADRAGKFRYRCSVSCGTLHPFMLGELVVGPNVAFARVVALTLVVVAGTLFSLWQRPPREPGEQGP